MTESLSTEYVAYYRKSKGRTGLARQRAVTVGHVERLGGRIVAEFTDTDATAFQRIGEARPERPDFDRMVAYLRAHPGTGLAAWHADRLTRNMDDTRLLTEVCAAGRHLIETPRGGSYDLSVATGRKRLRDDASDASYEVDHAIERISAQKNEAAARGEFLGGPVPFGWDRRDDGTFVLCAAEADAIRKAVEAITTGASLASVARRWNDAGITTKKGYRWTAPQVRLVLLSGRNAGLHVHKGQVTGVTAQWPAIVTEAEWRACRAILTDPIRKTSTGTERKWLGSGLFLCGVCGGKLIAGGSYSRGAGHYRVYRCAKGAERQHVSRSCQTIDDYVGQAVILRLSEPDAAPAFAPVLPDLSRLRTELDAARAEQDDLAEMQKAGRLTVRQVAAMTGPLIEREQRLEAELARAAMPSPLEPFASGDIAAVWERLDLDRKRAVVHVLMTVTVHPAPKGRPPGWKRGEPYFDERSIEIAWM